MAAVDRISTTATTLTEPLRLFDESRRGFDPNGTGGARSDTDLDDATEQKLRQPIRCRKCEQELSDTDALFLIDSDRLTRVFANPHGYLHEIVTVRSARGLTVVGPATTEFTWFAGYAWEIAMCDLCGSHIGWAFNATCDQSPELFWGLRRNMVIGVP